MSTAMLRDSFQKLFLPANRIQAKYPPQIQQEAATLDTGQILALMRGSIGGSYDGER